MKNERNKALMAFLGIFAAIGIICVIGIGVFGVIKITQKIAHKNDVNGNVATITLEEENISSVDGLIPNEASEANKSDSMEMKKQTASPTPSKSTTGLERSSSEINGVFEDVVAPEETSVASVEVESTEPVFADDGKKQIVFFGDSILDHYRDDTGIVYLVGKNLDANVINLSIGGTCASISQDNTWDDANWDSTSGAGMAKAVAGLVDPDAFYDCTAKRLLEEYKNDFVNTDIFVIEYGINDFLSGRPMCDVDNLNNPTTYEGGLRQMMKALTTAFPEATIILCQPTYIELFGANGAYLGNSYVMNNGQGTEYDYGQKTRMVANDYGALFFSFEDTGITMANNADTLIDGIHLSQEGRRIYSENLTGFIRRQVPGFEK